MQLIFFIQNSIKKRNTVKKHILNTVIFTDIAFYKKTPNIIKLWGFHNK